MPIQYFLQIFLSGVLLCFIQTLTNFIDLYWPIVAFSSRVCSFLFLYNFGTELPQIVTGETVYKKESFINNNSIVDVLNRNLKKNSLLGNYNLKLNKSLIYIVGAFLVRFIIDYSRYILVCRQTVKSNIEGKKIKLDFFIALTYITQLIGLIFWNYKTRSRVITIVGKRSGAAFLAFFEYYIFLETRLLLVTIFILASLFVVLYRSYSSQYFKREDLLSNFVFGLKNTLYLHLDLIVRLFCVRDMSFYYYLLLCQVFVEILVTGYTCLKRQIKKVNNEVLKNNNFFSRDLYQTSFTVAIVFLLSLVIEFSLIMLDIAFNASTEIILMSIICESVVYIFFFYLKNKRSPLINYIDDSKEEENE